MWFILVTIGWLLLICITIVLVSAILLGLTILFLMILAAFGKVFYILTKKENKLYELYKELNVHTWGDYRYR